MSDIHQEWHELRQKNGDFISHLDGEMAKIEKEKRLLDEQKEQIFYDPMTCTYFKADPEEIQKKFESMRKDLVYKSECIAKMTADYSALIEEKAFLQEQLDAAQKEIDDFTVMYDKAHAEAHQAKVAKDRMGYSNRCMQSKIAKQANEIKRLTEENKQLHKALEIAAKDADANFERGKIKGMKEIWDELKDVYAGRPTGENNKIFGYHTVGDILMNLSPTWFMNKAEEYHKQEKKEACNVQIGDEVQCFDLFCPDDDPHSDIGIVVAVDSERRNFVVVGPNFEGCFDTTDIQFGTVKKTGRHFDSIPLDYLA